MGSLGRGKEGDVVMLLLGEAVKKERERGITSVEAVTAVRFIASLLREEEEGGGGEWCWVGVGRVGKMMEDRGANNSRCGRIGYGHLDHFRDSLAFVNPTTLKIK